MVVYKYVFGHDFILNIPNLEVYRGTYDFPSQGMQEHE